MKSLVLTVSNLNGVKKMKYDIEQMTINSF